MKIEEYISKLIEHLGFEGEIEIKIEEGDERVHINIQTDEKDTALLIGNKGETLSAIELLTKLSFKDDYPDKRIVLDINQYKLRQEERLKEKALSLANRVLETGKSYEFRYLNSYERHLVHEVIANEIGLESLTSYSEDRDLGRVLIIDKKKNA
ncbi:MAG: KH domain-containing protein [Candidatus Pacebacteria bacterium]|jgi:spoIIIJ-associated protein|nr:KH domain-containing protein [Candidatus Paceibacterota bacterium]